MTPQDESGTGAEGPRPSRPTLAGRVVCWSIVILVLVGLGLAIYHWRGTLGRIITKPGAFRAWVDSFGPCAPLVMVLVNALQVVIAPIPGQVVAMASGALFGPWLGFLYSLVGSVLGTGAVLVLTRRWGRPFVERLVHAKHLERLDNLVARAGKVFFLLVFILPFGPHDLVCYAIGLTALPLGQMFVLLAIGRVPGTLVASFVGHGAVHFGTLGFIALLLGAVAVGLLYLRWGKAIERAVTKVTARILHRFAPPSAGEKPPETQG